MVKTLALGRDVWDEALTVVVEVAEAGVLRVECARPPLALGRTALEALQLPQSEVEIDKRALEVARGEVSFARLVHSVL